MLMVFRILVLSLVLFSSGVIVGWWFHHRYPVPDTMGSDYSQLTKGSLIEPFQFELDSSKESQVSSRDLTDFLQALDDGRTEDVLTIYQRHERVDSHLTTTLRHRLFDQIDTWDKQQKYDAISAILERFTEYYYQDLNLLKALAANYETARQLDKAIEVYLTARPYAELDVQLRRIDAKTHNLAKELFEQHSKEHTLEALIPLLQKLAWTEPDYAFYRFALARSYIAVNDIDSAIRELEMLQLDVEYGDQASRLLASLLPPPTVESDDGDDANTIPLAGSGGHYIVQATVGDKYNANLLIDTGSSLTTLPGRILKELRRNNKATYIEDVQLKTANGFREIRVYRLKEFQIGHYILPDLDVAELELNTYGSDGLLGMNVLEKFNFFIDQNRQTLSLTPR